MPRPQVYDLPVLIISVSIAGSMPQFLGPIMGRMSQSLGVDNAQVAAVISAFGVGAAFNGIVIAPSVDRFGTRRVMRIALVIFAAAVLIGAMAKDTTVLIAAHLIAGAAAGAVLLSCYIIATLIAKEGSASKSLSRVLVGWPVAMVVIAPLIALISEAYSWSAAYVMLGVAALTIAYVARVLPVQTGRTGVPQFPHNLKLLSSPFVILLITIFFLHNFTYVGAFVFLPQVALASLHLSSAGASLFVLVFGIGFILASVLSPWLSRLGATNWIIACLFSQLVIYALMPVAISYHASYLALGFVWGFFNQLLVTNVVYSLTFHHPGEQGGAVGLNNAATYTGMALGSGFAAILFAKFGFEAICLSSATGIGAAGSIALWYRFYLFRRNSQVK